MVGAANRLGSKAMAQISFFDLRDRNESLDARKHPRAGVDAALPWEAFRAALERVWRNAVELGGAYAAPSGATIPRSPVAELQSQSDAPTLSHAAWPGR